MYILENVCVGGNGLPVSRDPAGLITSRHGIRFLFGEQPKWVFKAISCGYKKPVWEAAVGLSGHYKEGGRSRLYSLTVV